MRNQKHIMFDITVQKKVPINIPLEVQRKYPVHSDHMMEFEKKVVVYRYIPDPKCNEQEYIGYLMRFLKKKYNAFSITYGFKEPELKK